MKITPGGIQLNGDAMILDSLMTSSVSSKKGQPLTVESSQSVTLNARDSQGRIANKVFLGTIKQLSSSNRLYYASKPDWRS